MHTIIIIMMYKVIMYLHAVITFIYYTCGVRTGTCALAHTCMRSVPFHAQCRYYHVSAYVCTYTYVHACICADNRFFSGRVFTCIVYK